MGKLGQGGGFVVLNRAGQGKVTWLWLLSLCNEATGVLPSWPFYSHADLLSAILVAFQMTKAPSRGVQVTSSVCGCSILPTAANFIEFL